jgi:hypothetical protein
MAESGWNPWKTTAIVMAVAVVTAVVTGLVVANWTGNAVDHKTAQADRTASEPERVTAAPAAVEPKAPRMAAPPASAARPAPVSQVASTPTPSAVEACNQQAAQQVGQQNKTVEVVKDGAIGALVGAAVGAAGGAIADGGKGAGKGAAIGGVVGAGAGTLYGLNENKKNDERYRSAYSACMRSRGYTS